MLHLVLSNVRKTYVPYGRRGILLDLAHLCVWKEGNVVDATRGAEDLSLLPIDEKETVFWYEFFVADRPEAVMAARRFLSALGSDARSNRISFYPYCLFLQGS
jgi:hypothetical protein